MSVENDIKEQYPILTENFEERTATRYINQYQESERIIAEAQAFAAETDRMKTALLELLVYRWLDTAEGVTLDIIGEIVGQPRVSIPDVAPGFFGYQPLPPVPPNNNLGYGNGRYRLFTDVDPYIILSDSEYRIVIIARIFANHTASTPDEVTAQFGEVFGLEIFTLNYRADLRIYFINGQLTAFQRVLLTSQWQDGQGQNRDFLPITLGVKRNVYESRNGKFFGFAENPNVYGFGVGALAINVEDL